MIINSIYDVYLQPLSTRNRIEYPSAMLTF